MPGLLSGKIAVITGGGGAMGGEQCSLFASEGASVCVVDNRLEKAEERSNLIIKEGGKALPYGLDVRDQSEWAKLVEKVESEFGHINILCNNAGANFRVSFEDQTLEQFNQIIEVGLTGTFLGIKAVIPSMKKAGDGVILNMGSLASIRPGGGSPGYAAQKMGMVGINRSAAASFAKYNIRSVIISPGHVDTPFLRESNAHSPNEWDTSIANPKNYNQRKDGTPLGRLQVPNDLAQAFLFAASGNASMITGSMITVDGGAAL